MSGRDESSTPTGQRGNAGAAGDPLGSRPAAGVTGTPARANSAGETGSDSRVPKGLLADRCVIGFKGLLNEAIEKGVVPEPPLCDHNGWKVWRAGLGLRPSIKRGSARGSGIFTTPKDENHLWRFAMLKCYGANLSLIHI